jgi:hypothetical protein
MNLDEMMAPMSTSAGRENEFKERRMQRKNSRKKRAPPPCAAGGSTLDTHGFLSFLPECNADIAYRFCFTILGFAGKRCVEAACNTEVLQDATLPQSPSKKSEEGYRCFCHVLPGTAAKERYPSSFGPQMFNSDVPKLCKMIFSLADSCEISTCRTRMEALSSALVCILVVDPVKGEPSFHEQLLQYERVVDQIHFTRKPLRPARALLLCRHKGCGSDETAPPPAGHLPWTKRLEEHEACLDEHLWKLGPVNLHDAQALHEAFATIATQRVVRSEGSLGEDSDGSQQSDAPPCYEAEQDLDHPPIIEEDEEPCWMTNLAVDTDTEDESARMPEQANDTLGHARYSGNRATWMSPMQRGAA